MPAAAQAQEQVSATVHQNAVQASAALNKLAKALKDAGVPNEVVQQVDEMANATNQLASAAVGNTAAAAATPEPAPEPPAEPEAPPEQAPDIASGVADLHAQMQAGPDGAGQPQPAFPA